MAECVFTSEMLELLCSMKGKMLKSYECDLRPIIYPVGEGTADGGIRINLGRSSIDLDCEYVIVDYFDIEEELTTLTCKVADPGSPLYPAGTTLVPVAYLVDEKIMGVEVVRDRAEYQPEGYVLEMDMAVIIRTKFHTFIFSRSHSFLDFINIRIFEAGHPVELPDSINELWLNRKSVEEAAAEGMTVARTVEVL